MQGKTKNGYLYKEVEKKIQSLPGSVKQTNKWVVLNLSPKNYYLLNLTAVLYKHDNNLINSILVVDNFGMKYENRSNVLHLWYVLKKLYSNYILVRKIPHRNIFYLGLLQHLF